jgi:hypothetical protein
MTKKEAILQMIAGKKIRRSAWIHNPYLYIYYNEVTGQFKYPPDSDDVKNIIHKDCVEINDFPNTKDYEVYSHTKYRRNYVSQVRIDCW